MNTRLIRHSRAAFVLLMPMLVVLLWVSAAQETGQVAAISGSDEAGWSLLLEAKEGLHTRDLAPVNDGGAILVGSGGGNYTFAVQIKPDGTLGWQKRFGSINPYEVKAAKDGGYLLIGGGALLMKLDSQGEIAWQKSFGQNTSLYDVADTADGAILVVGKIGLKVFALKLSSTGDVIWQRNWQKTDYDGLRDIFIAEGHYLLFGNLGSDPWIIKLAADGTRIWERKVNADKPLTYIILAVGTNDGNVLIYSYNDGNPWLAQLLADGTLGWQKTFSSPKGRLQFEDMAGFVNGDVLIVGLRERSGNNFFIDGWVMAINGDGKTLWQRSYRTGRRDFEPLNSAAIDGDNRVYVAGDSSNEGGISSAAWVMKLVGQGHIARCPSVQSEEVITAATAFSLEVVNTSYSAVAASAKDANWSAEPLKLKSTRLCPLPHLSIEKTGPPTAVGGVPFSYSLTVTNNASEVLTGVEIHDRLPVGATYLSGGSVADGEVTWIVGRLEGGAQATEQLTISARRTVTNVEYAVSCAEGYSTTGDEAIVTQIENQIWLPAISSDYCAAYYDDFSDPASGWLVENNDLWRTRYVAGMYELHTKDPIALPIAAPTCARWYYVVEADMQWESTPGPGIGLLFDIAPDGQSFSALTLDTFEQTFQYHEIESGSSSTSSGSSPFIKAGRTKNHLRITRTWNEIVVEINGEPVDSFYVYEPRWKTRVGVVSMSSEENPSTIARFDNFSYVWAAGESK